MSSSKMCPLHAETKLRDLFSPLQSPIYNRILAICLKTILYKISKLIIIGRAPVFTVFGSRKGNTVLSSVLSKTSGYNIVGQTVAKYI